MTLCSPRQRGAWCMNVHKAKRSTTKNRNTGDGDIAHDIVDICSLTPHSGDAPQLIRMT